jgi:hypothetical protein
VHGQTLQSRSCKVHLYYPVLGTAGGCASSATIWGCKRHTGAAYGYITYRHCPDCSRYITAILNTKLQHLHFLHSSYSFGDCHHACLHRPGITLCQLRYGDARPDTPGLQRTVLPRQLRCERAEMSEPLRSVAAYRSRAEEGVHLLQRLESFSRYKGQWWSCKYCSTGLLGLSGCIY